MHFLCGDVQLRIERDGGGGDVIESCTLGRTKTQNRTTFMEKNFQLWYSTRSMQLGKPTWIEIGDINTVRLYTECIVHTYGYLITQASNCTTISITTSNHSSSETFMAGMKYITSQKSTTTSVALNSWHDDKIDGPFQVLGPKCFQQWAEMVTKCTSTFIEYTCSFDSIRPLLQYLTIVIFRQNYFEA